MAIKSSGGKKTDNVTVRFEPKLRYLAELAAKSQKRSLSAFVEWAVENALERVTVRNRDNRYESLEETSTFLWDVEDVERFVRLAYMLPDLLTYEEQVIWKIINKYPFLLSHSPFVNSFTRFENINISAINKQWEVIFSAATGNVFAAEELEQLDKKASAGFTPPSPPESRDDIDDVPF